MNKTKYEAISAIQTLKSFINPQQLNTLADMCRGEEKQYFFNKLCEMSELINNMPKTYEQDGKGGEAIAYLHYFLGGMDFYITEKDMELEQLQAFGLANIGYGAELGYVCIVELLANGVELDLHFTPKTINQIKGK